MTLLAFTSSGIERDGSKGDARRTQRKRGIAADGGGTNAKAAASFMRAGELTCVVSIVDQDRGSQEMEVLVKIMKDIYTGVLPADTGKKNPNQIKACILYLVHACCTLCSLLAHAALYTHHDSGRTTE